MDETLNETSIVNLFMIEEIDAENNTLFLANYIFDERKEIVVTDDKIKYYAYAFDEAIEKNMFLLVEFDEERGVIIG